MPQPNSRVQRAKAAGLRAAVNRAAEAAISHRKICAICHNDHNWPHKACDTGWQLAKAVTKASHILHLYLGDDDPNQLTGQLELF